MKWISVNDRLPEETSDYLVFDGEMCCTVAAYKNGIWEVFADFWSPDEITHWMPLPEPPEK